MKKTSGYFHIVLHLAKMSIADLVNLALALVYDTDADYTLHPFTQAQLAVLANTVRAELGTRLTTPNPTLTKQEQIDVDVLSRAILEIASGVTVAANKKAKGDRALFDLVVNRIGFHPAAAHGKHVRIFEIRSVGKGMGSVTYTFQLGITTAIGVLPVVFSIEVSLGNPEFFIDGLPLGKIFAIQYAATIIPSHKKTSAATGAGMQRTATQTSGLHNMVTLLPVNKQGKLQLTYGVPFIKFSHPIYMAVS